MDGGTGNDTLEGGDGTDTITGGDGEDVIKIDDVLHGVDNVLDFDNDETDGTHDTLDLTGSSATDGTNPATDVGFTPSASSDPQTVDVGGTDVAILDTNGGTTDVGTELLVNP